MAGRGAPTGTENVDTLLAMANTVSTMAGVMSRLAASEDAVPLNEVRRVYREATDLLESIDHSVVEAVVPVEDVKPVEDVVVADVVAADVVELDAGEDNEQSHHLLHVLGSYAKYVAMFVGAGLVSGSVVHFPLAPTRYAVIGAIGAVLFTVASIVSEFRKEGTTARGIVKIGFASLALALGIGMMSGGIQHFDDFPTRAAKLIPIGMGVSIVAFIFRNNLRLRSEHIIWLAAGMVWILIMLAIALNAFARSGESAESGGHSHGGTETSTAATTEAHAESSSAPTPSNDAPAESAAHGH